MKCIVLAAGYATRLHPVAKYVPKPLLDMGGKPMIDYIISKVRELGVTDICVVTNQTFYPLFAQWGSDHRVQVINDGTTSNENRRGAVGDLLLGLETLGDDDYLIVGGDNLCEDNLKELHATGHKHRAVTIGLYNVQSMEHAKRFGVVTCEQGRVKSFVEKPTDPQSTLISTLVYFLPKESLPRVRAFAKQGKDNSGELIMHLMEHLPVHGVTLNGKWVDIGSLEHLENTRQEFREGKWQV